MTWMPALFYFHVAKTAGTSLINEIRQHFAEADILNEGVNITLPFLQAYGKERLREVGFIHGHPGFGVAAYLEGVADAIMLLRNPMDQAISNFLSLTRIHTDLVHRTATGLGFRDFVRTYPEFLVFQTLSLATVSGFTCEPTMSTTACRTCSAISKARDYSALSIRSIHLSLP